MSKNIINVDSLNKYHQGLKVTYLDPLEKKIDEFKSGDKFLNEVTRLDGKIDESVGAINSQLAQTMKYTINVPEDYEFEDLEDFINNNTGSHIKFPHGKEYTITKQLVVNNHVNTSIDFNNCVFTVVDNSSMTSRYLNSNISIGDVAIAICNSTNILIENIMLDGNRINNSDNLTQTGIHIQNVDGLIARNINAKSFVSKMVTIYHNTRNINISDITMCDLGNGTAPAYFFISNEKDGSFVIRNVFIDNDEIINTAQVFYNAGYNGVIENVKARNVHNVADFRRGRHIIRNVMVDRCNTVFLVQKYPNEEGVALSDVIIENTNATSVCGSTSGTCGVYIVDCNSCFINNLTMSMETNSSYSWYGVRVRKNAGGSTTEIKHVNISNTVVTNAKTSSFRVDDIADAIYLNNIKHINNYYTTSLPIGIGGGGMSGVKVICNNFVTEGETTYKVGSAITSNVYMPYSHNLLSSDTNDRPAIQKYREVGYCLFDTTLSKPIWWNGTKWVDSTGANV